MDKKFGLLYATFISVLGILLILMSVFSPALSIVAIAIPVPFAIIGTMSDKRYIFLSLVATLLVSMICVSPIYAISVCTINVIPGLIIGSLAKNNIKEVDGNKFEPIYGGTIAFVVCTIAFYFISKSIFGVNLIDEFNKSIAETFAQQMSIMKQMNIDIYKDMKSEDLIKFMNNMIPTMLFLQGLITAFITYYLEVFILKKTKILNIQKPTFRDFYLPGNAVGTSFMLYMLVLLLGFMNLGLYTDSIMFNLQMVFNFMFIVQGIAVSLYYARKWLSQGTGKNVLISGILLGIFGTMAISFIGMLDSIIDFRKVRSYKST
ncbi:MAG: DUF2232 domain-containing protein [Peptostreptococcaceae bacterium]